MSVETRIKKIEKALNLGHKPKLFGKPIGGCEWTNEDEAKLLAKAQKLGEDLPRPIMGNRSMRYEM